MSTSAAQHHRLKGRGTLTPGSYADIVLFDMDGLEVTGDPVEPRRYPKGVEYVFVNGTAAVEGHPERLITPHFSSWILNLQPRTRR